MPRVRMFIGRCRRRAHLVRSSAFESRLLWIFGSPRSGSTWVLHLLGSHSSVVPVDEPLIGLYFSPFLSDSPGWGVDELDSSNFSLRRIQGERPDQFFAREFAHVWRPALARLVRERFLAHVLRYRSDVRPSHSIVAIKEPNGSQSADLIMEALPRSRLLFLLRDGRDVVDSDLAAVMKGSWATKTFPGAIGIGEADREDYVRQSAKKWLWRTEVVQEAFEAHQGRKLLMRYEDLRADPVARLRELFDWLELRIDELRIAAIVQRRSFDRLPEEQRGPKSFYRAATPGNWRVNLSAEEQDLLQDIIGPKLSELGY
jgi:sulfotransferase family protein